MSWESRATHGELFSRRSSGWTTSGRNPSQGQGNPGSRAGFRGTVRTMDSPSDDLPDSASPEDSKTRPRLSPEEVRILAQPSAWQWILRVLGEWLQIAGLMGLAGAWNHPLGYLLAAWAVGARQHALGMLGHDAAHFAISRNKRLNDAIGAWLVFWPMGGGLDAYRRFHFAHHRKTGQAEDPEHPFKKGRPLEWPLPWPRGFLARTVAKDLVGLGSPNLLRLGALAPPTRILDVAGPLGWALFHLGLVAYFELWWMAGIWALAFVTSHWACFRLRVWTEHTGTAGTHPIRASAWQRWLFLPQNTFHHAEHHRYPSVPSWNLPEVRRREGRGEGISVGELFGRYRTWPEMPASIAPFRGSSRGAALLLLALGTCLRAGNFVDLPSSHFAQDAARRGIARGLFRPAGERFRPEDLITRRQLARILARAVCALRGHRLRARFGCPKKPGDPVEAPAKASDEALFDSEEKEPKPTPKFKDAKAVDSVPEDRKAVRACLRQGWIELRGENFEPEELATRRLLFRALGRFSKDLGVPPTQGVSRADLAAEDPDKDELARLETLKIFAEKEPFSPNSYFTKGQLALFLDRWIQGQRTLGILNQAEPSK